MKASRASSSTPSKRPAARASRRRRERVATTDGTDVKLALASEQDNLYEIDSETTSQQPAGTAAKRQRNSQTAPSFGFRLYRLRQTRHLPLAPYETDLPSWFEGDVQYACLMDYLVDIEWLVSLLPQLKTIPRVLIVHGARKDDRLKASIEKHELWNVDLHYPPLPIPFGKHHTKACVLKFPDKLRVVVHTANLTYSDCGEKTQGAWVKDFPSKVGASDASAFEEDLTDYLSALELPAEKRDELMELVKTHDFSTAGVKLIASVPGYHKAEAIDRYGHLLMRRCLSEEIFSSEFGASPLVCQISSLGALDQKWLMEEFVPSMCAGSVEGKDGECDLPLPPKDADGLKLIWPTIEQVRLSTDGWASGRSTAGLQKNVRKPFLQGHWHKYDGRLLDRQRALPHIKTYTRYARHRLAWVLLTSHNLSKAAWGVLQKQGEQFMIRSFELGVLFLPSLQRDGRASDDFAFVPFPSENEAMATDRVHFCLPYAVPPAKYSEDDDPCVTDVRLPGLDEEGRKWGSRPTRYGLLEPATKALEQEEADQERKG